MAQVSTGKYFYYIFKLQHLMTIQFSKNLVKI
jgi:hypothetical protein